MRRTVLLLCSLVLGLWLLSDAHCQFLHKLPLSTMALNYTAAFMQSLRKDSYKFPGILKMHQHLGIIRRPKYIHRGSRRSFSRLAHSNNIDSVWSGYRNCAGAQNRTVNVDNLCAVKFSMPTHTPCSTKNASFALLNVRSLNNKGPFINDTITDMNLDFMCLTETWQLPNDYMTLNEAAPPGYVTLAKPRLSGRGGGLAVIHRSCFKVDPVPLPVFTSFECLSFSFTGSQPSLVLLVYRPPKTSSAFITDFTELLSSMCPKYSSIVVLGDFNIHVDSNQCNIASQFLNVLNCFDFTQHINFPTHSKGHTLDLVCSSGTASPHDISPKDLSVSDHIAILFHLAIPVPQRRLRPLRSITYRNIRNINMTDMEDLLQSQLSVLPLSPCSDELVTFYNSNISATLNKLAPLKTRKVSFSHSAPWYTPELREMKATGRRLERLSRKTGLTVHTLAYKEHVHTYKEALNTAKTSYYTSIISKGQNNPRTLFSTVHKILQPPTTFPLTPSTDLCCEFLQFFGNKISTLYSQLQSLSSHTLKENPSQPIAPPQPLSSFFTITDETVHDLATKAKSTTCLLDPMPTPLVKACLPALCPLISNIINTSLLTGTVPKSLKTAAITPILKKPGAAADDFNNYRPISNLPFLSKLLERTVAAQLQDHMTSCSLWEELQSGFRAKHSTETALVKVINDLLVAADTGHFSILLLLDLTAAFDTVCHNTLLTRLETQLGITGTALSWFRSYLTGREQFVSIGDFRSPSTPLPHGVPQGSVLGPLLFIIYILPLGQILRQHGLHFHCYADDTQIYIHSKPSHLLPLSHLSTCLNDISNWMTHNFLKLNHTKTEAIVIATPTLLKKLNNTQFSIPGYFTTTSSEVKNLGVIFDSTLSFDSHIKLITKTAFFHLKTISRLHPFLSLTTAETLIHAFITSRLDYCNALLTGLPAKSINRLQYIQNSAARLLTHTRPWHHITPILHQLHWLPVQYRIHFKVLLLVYKAQHNLAPTYLTNLLNHYLPTRTLRSSDSHLLSIPSSNLRSMGDRAFSVAGPKLWNSLPLSIRQCPSLSTFKSSLKTHLFTLAFPSE